MNGYTHMVFGGMTAGLLVSATIASKSFGFGINGYQLYPLLMVIPAVAGGLGPDIDMPNSKSGKWVRKVLTLSIFASGIGLIGMAIGSLLGGTTSALIPLIIFFVAGCALMTFVTLAKHRRETHSGIVCALLLSPLIWLLFFGEPSFSLDILFSVWSGFWLGWFSHLIADSFNKKGVPWLFPLKNSKGKYTHYHILAITTGTEEETIFRVASIVIMIVLYLIIIVLGGWLR